jgi:hypothetical protein
MADLIQLIDPVSPELRRIESHLDAAANFALYKVGLHVQSIAVRQANRIAARPVPTRAQVNAYNRKGGGKRPRRIGGSGAKAWTQTGRTVESIKQGLSSVSGGQVSLTADVPWALKRHGLGVDWQPKRPALGIMRKNPFFSEAIVITAPQAGPIFNNAFANELKLP